CGLHRYFCLFRILCKFFIQGACLKGEHCEYSHDLNGSARNICSFYQKGICSYGSRCRYEHVNASQSLSSSSSAWNIPRRPLSSDSEPVARSSQLGPASAEHSSLFTPTEPAWNLQNGVDCGWEKEDASAPRIDVQPRDRPICSFAAAGDCQRGDRCPHIHGDLCPTCGKNCLHPFRPEEREEHTKECEKKQKHVEALKHSQDIECSVCLDRVLSKPTPAERKFGLLTECDHPFCIQCIRNWRSSAPVSGMDVNNTLRACPICRKRSYFVVPSVVWYSTPEEKNEIINTYKAKLRSIDCKHFNFGNGTCPFGTSCFYKHAYPDGRLEEVVLRHLGSQDGEIVIADNIRLSDFLGDLRI
ncbi:PREDICTED: E3 ubiquitin-protein ligase makorin-like, partial [Tarenaya hassleriana]|uniref:E3 ubiquitin-protein ligase makorin-like n=1 Tax=Tarenaya hassleriana TaxID=28532 RepID=UPI00053C4B3A